MKPRERNYLAKITVPIALIIFKRTETLQRIVDELNKHEISKLYIVADGPRTAEERNLTSQARKIAESITCGVVIKLYSEKNLGLKNSLTSGISVALEDSSQLIVLEDDCLPSEPFLTACQALAPQLSKSQNIAGFCGSSFLPQGVKQGIWRSAKLNVWGWMVNSKAWHDFMNSGFLDFDSEILRMNSSGLDKLPPLAKWEMMRIIKRLDKIDTWDVQFETFCLNKGYDFIKPKQNLIQNIGFESDATNTQDFGKSLSLKNNGDFLKEVELPRTRKVVFEWVEHTSKIARLVIELALNLLPRKR